MSCNSDLDLEGKAEAEAGEDVSTGDEGSVSGEGLGESVAGAQLSGPMVEASAESSSEGAASATGSNNLSKRGISELTKMSEEETSR